MHSKAIPNLYFPTSFAIFGCIAMCDAMRIYLVSFNQLLSHICPTGCGSAMCAVLPLQHVEVAHKMV